MKTKLVILMLSTMTIVYSCNSSQKNDKEEKTVKSENQDVKSDVSELSSSFKVFGNCGMCESRIEQAAMEVEGVNSASWDSESKLLKITYGENFDITPVYKAVVAVGHDTENGKADDDVYNSLPGCCKYDRE